MKIEYKNFIGTYKDVYPTGYCQHLIDQFDILTATGAGSDRNTSEGAPRHRKDDFQLPVNMRGLNIEYFQESNVADMFFNGLQRCFSDYTEKYSVLTQLNIRGTHMKLQRTDPGGGYHIWHSEQGPNESSSRILVYLLYLNTLAPEQAGETEFLYQQQRVAPVENTMVIWPAAFTHTHRGNTVFGDKSKYIATGWFTID